MSSCGRCTENVLEEDGCLCAKCAQKFHFHCSTVKKATWVNYGLVKQKQWRCTKCRDGSSECSTPTAEVDSIIIPNPSLKQLNMKMDLILKSHIESKNEMAELKNMISELKSELKNRDEKIQELNEKLWIMDQYSRNRNVEICNIPKTQGENLEEIVVNMASKMDITIEARDVDIVHRLPSRNGDVEPIIVQFCSRRVRDQFLSNKKKVITSYETTGEGMGKIFINANLNKYFKDLRYKAKQEANNHGYKFVWFKNNKILMKKNESSPYVFSISNEKDLLKFRPE